MVSSNSQASTPALPSAGTGSTPEFLLSLRSQSCLSCHTSNKSVRWVSLASSLEATAQLRPEAEPPTRLELAGRQGRTAVDMVAVAWELADHQAHTAIDMVAAA